MPKEEERTIKPYCSQKMKIIFYADRFQATQENERDGRN
jgi:hypothetical protein